MAEEDKLSKELEDEKAPVAKDIPPEIKKEIAKIKEKIEKFSKDVIKKFPFLLAIGLLPAIPSEEKDKEKKKPKLIIVFPDEKIKEVKKIEKEIDEIIKKQNLQIDFFTRAPSELWQTCFDGHFLDMEKIGMSYPLHDKGILSALRVATIHKNLVLSKFEKYVTSYVIAGSLVRGKATKTSDVDIYVVIDDTDVKRMPRFELKERLRAMIYSFAFEANEIAAAKNKLSPQIYILTEFWEAVKDANPVIFTFIRDGVPLYDRGAFMPWKLLLKMGKIKPSPEAIDNFMMLGEKMAKRVQTDLTRIATEDIYWGVITPSQAALMLYGLPPPTPLETIELMEKTFVDKEKLLEKKYITILDRIVRLYKDHEHGKIKEIKGKEIDELLTDASSYIARLKELVKQIEKHSGEKTILQIYDDSFSILRNILGNLAEEKIVEKFKSEFLEKGEMPPKNLDMLKEIIKAKQDYKKGKLSKHEVDKVRISGQNFIHSLTEYEQRKNLVLSEKTKFKVRVAGKEADLFILDDAYLVSPGKKEVWKINFKKKELEHVGIDELGEKLKNIPKQVELTPEKINDIKKILGKDIVFIF
ncbi:MAG: nucleotidyltransferase domain-containing protein [Nanoarchaeota archaeon]|nr:nucleotidyltransferase domain-containing protein [Nanoarchaeota archaeon]